MELKVKLDPLAYLPERAHPTDAGVDLRTPHDVLVMPGVGAVVDTGVHIQLPPGTVGMLKSKSGLNVKHGIVSEGVIDEGYTGTKWHIDRYFEEHVKDLVDAGYVVVLE